MIMYIVNVMIVGRERRAGGYVTRTFHSMPKVSKTLALLGGPVIREHREGKVSPKGEARMLSRVGGTK